MNVDARTAPGQHRAVPAWCTKFEDEERILEQNFALRRAGPIERDDSEGGLGSSEGGRPLTLRRPYSAQVFLVRILDGECSYLLLHRNPRPDLGLSDFWQGVSGALEVGEDFSAAARREVEEETGIQLDRLVDTGFQHEYPVRAEWRRLYEPGAVEVQERVFFSIVSAATMPTLSDEHQAWRWCTPDEAGALLTFGRNADCLRAVAVSIATHLDDEDLQKSSC